MTCGCHHVTPLLSISKSLSYQFYSLFFVTCVAQSKTVRCVLSRLSDWRRSFSLKKMRFFMCVWESVNRGHIPWNAHMKNHIAGTKKVQKSKSYCHTHTWEKMCAFLVLDFEVVVRILSDHRRASSSPIPPPPPPATPCFVRLRARAYTPIWGSYPAHTYNNSSTSPFHIQVLPNRPGNRHIFFENILQKYRKYLIVGASGLQLGGFGPKA